MPRTVIYPLDRGKSHQAKQKARLILEQSGIHVYEEPLFIFSQFAINLRITGLGLRTDNGACFGSLGIKAFRDVFIDIGDAKLSYVAVNFSQNGVALSRDNLNHYFLNAIDTYISQLASDVIAGRRDPVVSEILAKTPHDKTKPVTMKQLTEMLKGASKD